MEGGIAWDLEIVDDLAYIADGSDGLEIINISNPSRASIIGNFQIQSGSQAKDVQIVNSLAYLTVIHEGVYIIDISDPTLPREVGHIDDCLSPQGILVMDNFAYVIADEGFTIIDISDPTTPIKVGFFNDTQDGRKVIVEGEIAYILCITRAIKILDIGNKSNPVEIGRIPINLTIALDMVKKNNLLYFTDGPHLLQIYDVSNMTTPIFLNDIEIVRRGRGKGIFIESNRAYITTGEWVYIVNVSNPLDLTLIESIEGKDLSRYAFYTGGIQYYQDKLYLTKSLKGLEIMDLDPPIDCYSKVLSWIVIIALCGIDLYIFTNPLKFNKSGTAE